VSAIGPLVCGPSCARLARERLDPAPHRTFLGELLHASMFSLAIGILVALAAWAVCP